MTDATMQGTAITDADPRLDGMREEAHARGFTAGQKRGAAAERQRCAAIVQSPEAVGREALAMHFALHSDVTPEAAIAGLKASPPAAAVGSPMSEFEKRCEAGRERIALRGTPDGDAADVARILDSYHRTTGRT